ncbi:MAG: peptidase U32 family protein [Deltaproteobacteria bacterium]
MQKPEILAPAGDLERMKMALLYGADAVYIGGEEFSLRAYAANFSLDEMKEGIEFAHSMGKKVYITANIIPHNKDLPQIEEYMKQIADIKPDAVIASDLGVVDIIKELAPDIKIHISTQANNINWRTVKHWYDLGAQRVILARELSLEEIKEIRAKIPESLQLEAFVHGAMCISYSGRCLLSNYMAARESNMGACAHPCRWQYYLMEEKRPGEYFPVYENERGTFIFNSNDLCMIEHIPEIIESGIISMKIEGRMKSSFYVATVVKAYRQALDDYFESPDRYNQNKAKYLEDISKASHRGFTTGFYIQKPGTESHNYSSSSYLRDYDFIGIVLDYDDSAGIATVEQRNRFFAGDEIEVLPPNGEWFQDKIEWIKNSAGENIESAPNAQMVVQIPMERKVDKYSILRRRVEASATVKS